MDSEALDYIPDYDIETKDNWESNESQYQRQIPLEWGESFITFPIS